MPLISIIIPVYNVEKYLEECVDSVINQTYTNLEIILVDDGSTDSSPDICDDYGSKDVRIKVIHRTNGGLSAARNSGIETAQGEYISFLDSDDYIADNTIEFLYNAIVTHNADIAAVAMYKLFKNTVEPIFNFDTERLLTSEDAFYEAINMEYLMPSANAKLYKKKMFNGVRFPDGMLYEDTYVIGEVLHNAQTVYVSSKPFMYYRQCGSSIMHKQFKKKNMQLLTVYEHCLDLANMYYPKATELCKYRIMWAAFYLLQRMITCNATDISEFEYVVNLLKKNKGFILGEKRFSLMKRVSILILWLSPKLYIKLFNSISSTEDDNKQYFE